MAKNTAIELPNSVHYIPAGAAAAQRTNSNRFIHVTLGVRRRKDLPDLTSLDNRLPGERKYMTRERLAREFGSDPDAVTKIQAFARRNGLVVTREQPSAARLTLGGTVSDLSRAFRVTLMDYTHPTLGQFHARTGPVSVPPDLAQAITGVFGFSNQRILRRRRSATHAHADPTVKGRPWFVPTELAPIYNFPDADASTQCIGLLEFGGGVESSDVTAYFQKIGVPEPRVQVVPVDGVSTDPAADPDSTGEVMLDVDVAGGLGGGAKVAVYFSTFDEKGLIDCLAAVVEDGANDPAVLSMSWGWDENQPFNGTVPWSAAAIDHVNHAMLALAHLGVTVCVSTGDDGSEAQIRDGRAHVLFPASSPYVLAVGGTTLHARKSTAGKLTLNEVVWNDGPGSGGGGGISDYIPAPAWQSGVVPKSINPSAFVGRGIPDVAAVADPATGYLVMSGGKLQIVGGTSASAPLWASLVTRINVLLGSRAGNFNALLYSKFGPAGVLRDVTVGNNDTGGLLGGHFAAGPGWDACTGWGTPDGQKLLIALKG